MNQCNSAGRRGLFGPRAATLGAAIVLAIAAPALAAKKPSSKSMATISVEFSDDCTQATVESSKDVSTIVAVLTNLGWQKFEDLAEAPVYEFAVDPNGGEAIRRLYVKSGSFKQKDLLAGVPGFVGMGFDCTREGTL